MGTPVVNASSQPLVSCLHQGRADPQPSAMGLKVLVAGLPVMLVGPPAYQISGCALPPQSGGPCLTAVWSSGATKVRASGVRIATQTGIGVCAPTGTGVLVNSTLVQQKVKAL